MVIVMAVKKARARKKTGLAGAPTSGSFSDFRYYVQHEVDSKEMGEAVKNYVKREFDKPHYTAILANPSHELTLPILASICYWTALGNKFDGQWSKAGRWMEDRFARLYTTGDLINRTAADVKKTEVTKIVVAPSVRTREVALTTIVQDLYDIEDMWLAGKEATKVKYNLYNQLTIKDIKSFTDILAWINEFLTDYRLYIDKDEEIQEAYPDLTMREVKARVVFLEGLIADVDLFKNSKKATRTIKAKKPKGADKQVERLNFETSNADYKLTSVNPMLIPGSMNLYLFNTKTRQLTIYVSDTPDGLQVSGSTIKKFSTDFSQVMALRKPADILPDILKKTPKQITKLVETLKTVKRIPTGRINKDTVILRCQ
jgi:hypothetical protein